jgi:hypothetical protein
MEIVTWNVTGPSSMDRGSARGVPASSEVAAGVMVADTGFALSEPAQAEQRRQMVARILAVLRS